MSTDETVPGAGRPTAGPQYTPAPHDQASAYQWSPIVGSGQNQTPAADPSLSSPGYGEAHRAGPFGPATSHPSSATYGQGGWAPPVGPTTTVLTPPAAKARPRRLAMIILASSLSAVIGAGAGIGTYALSADGAPANTIAVSTAPAAQSAVLDGTVAAAAAKITPSVVTITVEGSRASGIGTGIVLDSAGHIVTNNHVVAAGGPGSTVTVTFSDDRTSRATVVGTAPSSDLAVIKVHDVSKLTPATFAPSRSVALGQAVVAVGSPLGLSETVTSGVVSTTARPVRSGNDNNAVYLAVQTDTAINPGNSGGPLVDLNGAVIGVNSSIASTSNSQQQAGNIGIGFAIPSDVVARVSSDLINSGSAADASLGVSLSGQDSLTSASTSTGVKLADVKANGAAARAGLQAGDVVTKVNDFETTTADGLIGAVRYYAPGTQVQVTYLRDKTSHTATVTLGQV